MMRLSFFELACVVAVVWFVMSLANSRHRASHVAAWMFGMLLFVAGIAAFVFYLSLARYDGIDVQSTTARVSPADLSPGTIERPPGDSSLPRRPPALTQPHVSAIPTIETTVADTDPADDVNSTSERPSTVTEPATDDETSSTGKTSTDQPDWVDAPPTMERGVYTKSISVGPYATRQECERELAISVQRAAKEYAEDYLGSQASRRFSLPQLYLMEHVLKEVWWHEYEHAFGEFTEPMFYEHARLEFDDKTRAEITERYRESMVAVRLVQVGGGAATIWGLLAAVFGYLKLDTWTRGYYTGRLRLLATAVILGLVGGFSALIMNTQ